jgi:Fe2+ transport system protein B
MLVFLNLMLMHNHLHLQFIRPVLLRHVWVERCLLQMTNYTKACVNSEKPCLMERPAKMQRTETRAAFIDGSLDYCFWSDYRYDFVFTAVSQTGAHPCSWNDQAAHRLLMSLLGHKVHGLALSLSFLFLLFFFFFIFLPPPPPSSSSSSTNN